MISETRHQPNFSGNLEKPVLAVEVYSSIELEYLRDKCAAATSGLGTRVTSTIRTGDLLRVISSCGICAPCWRRRTGLFDRRGDRRYPSTSRSAFGIDYSQYR